tara:strand:- start:2176 stop:2781 length:606 start_codon:yes stop_codon:yes gene_type:complete
MNVDPSLLEALQQGLFVSLCLGLGAAMLWGIWLCIHPPGAQRFALGADQWVATGDWFDRLNKPVPTSRWFYRNHRALGALIVLGSGYALIRWWTAIELPDLLDMAGPWVRVNGLEWLVEAGEWLFVGFNILFLIAGVVIFLRPSLLKTPEKWADRWVKVPADQALDRRFDPLEAAQARYPRTTGLLIALACATLLAFLLLG